MRREELQGIATSYVSGVREVGERGEPVTLGELLGSSQRPIESYSTEVHSCLHGYYRTRFPGQFLLCHFALNYSWWSAWRQGQVLGRGSTTPLSLSLSLSPSLSCMSHFLIHLSRYCLDGRSQDEMFLGS